MKLLAGIKTGNLNLFKAEKTCKMCGQKVHSEKMENETTSNKKVILKQAVKKIIEKNKVKKGSEDESKE